MDAAQTNIKKIAFLLAPALLLTAPFRAFAQPTLNVSTTTVAIGSSSCNDFQNVTVSSSNGTNLGFTAYILYATNNPYGQWLYTDVSGSGSTSNSTSFSASTGTSGTTLTIGLNQEIAAATPQATVVLTPTGGGASTNITVFYTQNTSCGGNTGSTSNGFFTVTPGSIAITAGTTSQGSQTVTIQNTIGTGTTFGFSVTPNGTWLSATANSTTISGGGTASVNVTANANQTAGVGTYVGTLTITPATGFGTALNIPVTFTVTNGGTGTGTGPSSGTLTVGNPATSSTYTANFSYIAPQAPSDSCIPIQDTATGADYYQAVVTTSNGGSWLLANNSTSGTTTGLLTANSGACVDLRLSNQLSSLTSGAYQGQVALTSSSGATATINVNLYVSAGVAPGITLNPNDAIFVFPNVAAFSSVVQQQVFNVSAATGYTMGTASLTSAVGGFSINTPVFSNNTQSFTITSNSTALTTGVYATTVTIPSTFGSSTNTTTITIVLPVGQNGVVSTGPGGGTTSSVVAPLTLAFQQQQNSSFWTSGREAQDVTITGASGGAWSASVVYATGSGNWLNFDLPNGSSGTFGSTPVTLAVDLFNGITGLAPSSTPYQATVSVTTPSGTTPIAVTLLVTPSNTPVLLGLPASTTFAAVTGTNPSTQTVTVVGSDNTSSTTTPPITAGTPTQTWLTATTSGNTMTISASPGSLGTGVYSATIPVSANAYANPIQYPVVMVVNGGGTGTGTGTGTGALTLSPTALTFSNVTVQTSQSLSISAATATQFTASSAETTCTGTTWLQASGAGTATPGIQTLNVTVFPSGIANGTTCTGAITLTTTSSGSTQTVNVTMTVGSTSTGSGNVTVSPTSMTFAYTQNQAVPPAQTATIVNAQSGTASIPFTVATQETIGTSVTWLQTGLGSAGASTPYNSPGLAVSVVPGSLAPGTYNGSVIVTPTGGSAVTIGVTLTVTGNAVVSASPTTLALSYTVGQTSPTATINVSGAGSSAGFTAVAASSSNFLQVSPTSGTTPNTGTVNLNVSVNQTVLASLLPSTTPYTGTVTITGTSPATGTTIVNVSLTVTAPLPVITGITNAASGAVGAISPGEIISIYANPANPIGPATAVKLDSTTCPGTCTQVPKSMGGVQVKFNPSSVFAPLTFVNQGQINAVVPYEVAGVASLSIEVLYLGQTSNAWPINLAPTAPGIFTANSSGAGQAAVGVYDNLGNYQPNGNNPSFPAKVGWTLVLYMTGEGVVSPQPLSGAVTSPTSQNPPVPLVAPHVLIGGQPATVSFYGEAPGLVSGVLQINVIVPAGAGTGPVPISVSLGTTSTQANVTVSLQ